MNATHILRRAALLTATAGLAGTALLGAGGTAYAAPRPGHDGHDHGWRHDRGNNHNDDTIVGMKARHPRQARNWDDDLERCNPSSCWRGFGGHWREGDQRHHGHGGDD